MSIHQQHGGRRGRVTSTPVRAAAVVTAERLEDRRLFSVQLIGISGNQVNPTPNTTDENLFRIDYTSNPGNPSLTQLVELSFVPDGDAIGYNPETGLLHRTSGADSYRDNPNRIGYHDNQFMQTINLQTMAQVGIFNANHQGEIKDDQGTPTGPYGLPAPFPTFVNPDHRRTDQETDPSFRARGPNEYHSVRDLVWSSAHQAFYVADQNGIFRLTADGTSTFVGDPAGLAEPKGIAFFGIGPERRLLVSNRNGPELYTLDPVTAQPIGSPVVLMMNGSPVPGMVSIVEHPDGVTLLGIAKDVSGGDGGDNRQLVQINPLTGETTSLGTLSTYIADLAFVPATGVDVVGSRAFYNNSTYDGNNPAANPADDQAIDPAKRGLLGTGPAASVNITSYSKGLNGVMIDLFGLPRAVPNAGDPLTPSDFTIRSTSAAAPNAFAAGPAPLSVSLRRGAGPGGSDRITLVWNDYSATTNPANEAVGNGYLEVTIEANSRTGLTTDAKFRFGNLIADANGDRTVNLADFGALRADFNQSGLSIANGRSDFNRDGTVNLADFGLLRGNFNKSLPSTPPAAPATAMLSSDEKDEDER